MRRLFRFVNDFFNLVNDFALAGRPALVYAIVFIGVEFAIDVEDPDFQVSLRDNFPCPSKGAE